MLCDDAAFHLTELGSTEDETHLPLPLRHHLATCLHCQAERSGYRRLQRELRLIRDEVIEPDVTLLVDILDSVRPVASVTPIRQSRRRVYVGGIAAAATAGAAGGLGLGTKLSAKGHRLAG